MPRRTIEYRLSDGREVTIEFVEQGGAVVVKTTFDAEDDNPIDVQRTGWQAIADNFGRHVEARLA